MVWLFHVNFLKIQVPALHYYYEIWKICATLKQQQPLKFIFPGPAASIPDYSLNFLVFVCHVLLYKILLPIFFRAHHSVFLVGKIAGKRWHRKEIKKFSLLFPHILCQLCEWWCWMDARWKIKSKKFFWHISLLITAPCVLFSRFFFIFLKFLRRRRVV